jgi:hypothetical protein
MTGIDELFGSANMEIKSTGVYFHFIKMKHVKEQGKKKISTGERG